MSFAKPAKHNAIGALTLFQPVVNRKVPVNDHVHKRSWKLDGDWVRNKRGEPALRTEKETQKPVMFFQNAKSYGKSK